MDWVKTIKLFYPKYWNKGHVWDAAGLDKITKQQYKEIVGEEYPNERPLL